MANLVSRDFSDVKPGDVMFYTTHDGVNRVIHGAQRLSPSTSALAAKYTHPAVVLKAERDKVQIAHSIAMFGGPLISEKTVDDLGRYKHVAFLSPTNSDNIPTPETLTRVATYSSAKFVIPNTEEEVCPSLPSSRFRLLRSFSDSKLLDEQTQQTRIAKNLADFVMENPQIKRFDEQGNPVRRMNFCAEFTHSLYQTAHYYDRLTQNDQEYLEALCNPREKKFDAEARDLVVDHITTNFTQLFPDEGQDNDFFIQNSASFSPGRLFTELQKKGYQVREIRPEQ